MNWNIGTVQLLDQMDCFHELILNIHILLIAQTIHVWSLEVYSMSFGNYRRGLAMSTRPWTSALRMPSTHPAIRNANHR